MRELRDILTAANRHENEPMALATVVRVEGSTYRRPGALMLVLAGGETIGTISGGCLEEEVALIAREVMNEGTARLLSFDLRARQGCNGVIEVLVECVRPGGFLATLAQAQRERRALVAATLFEGRGQIECPPGTHALIDSTFAWRGEDQARTAWGRLFTASREALKTGAATLHTHHLGDGLATSLVRAIPPPVRLVIFGGSDDSASLAAVAETLGWEIQPVHHPATDSSPRFRSLAHQRQCTPEDAAALCAGDARTAAVIMTHHFGRDAAFLQALLPLRLPYLGLLGPRRRREELLARVLPENEEFPAEALRSLHGPAGLDLGAETPEQVALAIVSEIQATLAGRHGGRLREVKHPIHTT